MFKVMTWNVENLFRPGHASGPQTQEAYDAKIQGLASVINDQSPDALAVQEIGDPATLDDLVKYLHGGTWHRQVSQHPDQRGIRVAWLTRRAISAPQDVVNFPPHLKPVQVDDNSTLAVMGRGAVAVTVQSSAGRDSDWRSERHSAGRNDPVAPRPSRLRDQYSRVRPARPGRPLATLESRAADARGQELLAN